MPGIIIDAKKFFVLFWFDNDDYVYRKADSLEINREDSRLYFTLKDKSNFISSSAKKIRFNHSISQEFLFSILFRNYFSLN